MKSLQEQYAPNSICFGCGPANTQGLRIRSMPKGKVVIATWEPAPHHEAFPGMLNGGIIGALLDCHSNWTAAWHLMQKSGQQEPPCTVTGDFHVKLLKPTPSGQEVTLEARTEESSDRRARVVAELSVGGEVCATCSGNFIAVKPGHPAYHRWQP
ncbi:MAG: PaaI family thioesterase [Gammaproteobacteria bacterium]|nr:PaaI family thioesterase [Gammaproteobacteria bacterium]